MNTEQDHLDLYDELKKVIYSRGENIAVLTPAQELFVAALEDAAFGIDFLKSYSELVNECPDIELRNLHAYCLGFGIGLSGEAPEINLNKTHH